MTWISAITAIFQAGAHPVFCDIEPDTPNLSAKTLTSNAAAIMATHAWGMPALVDQLAETGMPVVEDCSHAHGAIYRGRPVGSWGAAGCFSLQESKAVSAGEGGILTTSDRLVYERAMTVGHHPHRLTAELTLAETRPLKSAGASWKYRMPALNAVIGVEQLRRLPERAAASARNLAVLLDEINAADLPIRVPEPADDSVRGWYGVPLYFADEADSPRARHDALIAEGVPLRALYEDWTTSPVLADRTVAARFWPSARGYQPPCPDSLPNYQQARRRLVVLKIPDTPAESYMLDVAVALTKVTRAWPRGAV
jgi:dTDP-4-amino-4,6-dideoxygalactose transaminase